MENFVVIEVGAGVIVPTIRQFSEHSAAQGRGHVRINPSADECEVLESRGEYLCGVHIGKANDGPLREQYFPLVQHSVRAFIIFLQRKVDYALRALTGELLGLALCSHYILKIKAGRNDMRRNHPRGWREGPAPKKERFCLYSIKLY